MQTVQLGPVAVVCLARCHTYEFKKIEINQQTGEIIETNQTSMSIDKLLIHY